MNGTNARAGGGSWRFVALATLPSLLLLGWQAGFPWPFFSDDAFISLRYSERLLAGCGLTWTDGERVEGYSNLLWVLACSLLGGVGIELVTAARWLGGAATVAALWCIASAGRPRDLRSAALAATAPLLAASTQVVLGWTLGGLEGPLVLCLLAAGFGMLLRAHGANADVAAWPRRVLVAASVPFALLCVTRPDGPLWVLTTGVALAAVSRGGAAPRSGRAFWFGLVPMLAVLAQLLFRVVYHGDVVPNTAHVKAGFAPAALPAGVDYVLAAIAAHAGLFTAAVLASLGLALQRERRALAVVLAVPVLAWLCYMAAIGGDHFPGRRLLHSAVAPLALLAAAAVRTLATMPLRTAMAVFVLLAAAWNAWLARTDAQSHELRGEVWEWRGRAVGDALRRAFAAERPLLAVDAAGAVPFYSGLPSLDLLGLCDRTIATTPEPAWIATMRPEIPRPPGHLRGNGRYVMDRAPDLMLFGPPPGLPLPVFVSGVELEEDPRFLAGYRCMLVDLGEQRLVTGDTESLVMPLWLRVDGRAGARMQQDRIDVPVYLFGAFALSEPIQGRYQPIADPALKARADASLAAISAWFAGKRAVAVPGANGAFVLELRDELRAVCDVPLPAGHWQLRVEPADAAIDVTPATILTNVAAPRQVTLAAKPGAALPVRATSVVFERER